jgi:hypothetical protein
MKLTWSNGFHKQKYLSVFALEVYGFQLTDGRYVGSIEQVGVAITLSKCSIDTWFESCPSYRFFLADCFVSSWSLLVNA